MKKMLSYGCATWLLSLGAVQAQPANVTTAAATLVAPAAAMKPAEARPPIWESQPVANQPLVPQALQLNNPTVLTTARLQDGDRVVTLNGIEGLDGDAAQGLRTYLSGQHLACQPVDNDGFNCALPDGTNVAEAALINGAARTKPDASNAYREDEAQAQAARRGLWSNISMLPPVTVSHPIVQDTATLVADQTTFVLDGIQGLGEPYTGQLQAFLNSSGERAVCLPQSAPGRFVCTTNDGTDIAKVALVNGAATISPTASDAYRAQQADAMANHRGIWAEQPGLSYVDGEPRAWIDSAFVPLAYAGGTWGYYDYSHRWHVAPANYVAHLNGLHPGGQGLGKGAGGTRTASPGQSGNAGQSPGRSNQAGGANRGAMGGGNRGGTSHLAMGGGGRASLGRASFMGRAGGGFHLASMRMGGAGRRR
jgi:endonuclease YncB( thermonuclease family)